MCYERDSCVIFTSFVIIEENRNDLILFEIQIFLKLGFKQLQIYRYKKYFNGVYYFI